MTDAPETIAENVLGKIMNERIDFHEGKGGDDPYYHAGQLVSRELRWVWAEFGIRIEQKPPNTRADLPATNEKAFANEKVKALVEASEALMCDPTWGIEHKAYMKLRAALEALETE